MILLANTLLWQLKSSAQVFLKKIQIDNFRNITHCFLEFNENINYFVANNANGKTSFVEALYFLGHNKSFKEKNIKNIIHKNKDNLSIQSIIGNDNISIYKDSSNKNNTITINNEKIFNSSILSKNIPLQIISPDKGFIVGGDNKNKRYYLDWGMFHVEQDFLHIYKKSKKIQKNINNLIIQKNTKQLDVWFQEFAKTNSALNALRKNYLDDLKKNLNNDLFKNLQLNIEEFDYTFNNGLPKDIDTTENIYSFLIKNKEKIIKNKYLKYGSHLASIEFFFQNTPEKQLSRGQQKTLSIIFWLNQVIHLIHNNIKPIILIDDISSELDDEKIKLVIEILKKINTQVFITSIRPISDDFYNIKNGEIVYNN